MSRLPEYSPSEILKRFQGFDSTAYTADMACDGARRCSMPPPPSRPLLGRSARPADTSVLAAPVPANVAGGAVAGALATATGALAAGEVPRAFYSKPQFWLAVLVVLALVGFVGFQIWKRYKAYRQKKAQALLEQQRRELARRRAETHPTIVETPASARGGKGGKEKDGDEDDEDDDDEAPPRTKSKDEAGAGDEPWEEEDDNLTLLSELTGGE